MALTMKDLGISHEWKDMVEKYSKMAICKGFIEGKRVKWNVLIYVVGMGLFDKRYEGDFKDDKMYGKGTYYHAGGSKYDGEWKDDHPHGRGTEFMINEDVFEGEFKKGLKEGKGKLKGKDGSLITGIWKEGKI
jgi:hypothetical protein